VGAGTTHLLDVVGWAVCFEYAMHVDVADYLLAHGAKHTLLSAVAMGDAAAVRKLAAEGADLNERMDRTNRRRTPLHLAVIKKQPAALGALIELGADLNAIDATGVTPLDQSAIDGQDELTRRLIDAGASVTLPAAVILGREDVIKQWLHADPGRLSVTDNRGWARLLVHASGRASARVLETLLETVMRHRSGLSIVNMEDDTDTAVDGTSGYTPLHAAAFYGNMDAVALLLKHGANPRVRDSKYCGTPAGWAAYAGHLPVANAILDADVDIFDAISLDRGDRVTAILDADAGAIDRPFKAYAQCPTRNGQWWPTPDCTPLEWATSQHKPTAVRALVERGAGTRTTDDSARAQRVVTFMQSACWDHHVHGQGDHRMYDRAAQRLLAADPALARDSLYTAIVCGDIDEVSRQLAVRPDAARTRGGPRGWTPILYLAYTRFTHQPTIANALDIARLLLDYGADPNDFYMAGDAKYSVLTGIAGEGEQDSPRQPYAEAVFDLLLERGAEPFDIQVLYNTHFSGGMLWWLDLVYARTIDTPRGASWRDPEWTMLDMGGYGSGARFLLEMAIRKRDMTLARWALSRGANPNAAPARDRRFPKHSLYELAWLENLPAMAELLAQHGARRTTPALGDDEAFVAACLRLDRAEAQRLLSVHPEYRQSTAAMFEAAKRDNSDALALLLELGTPIEVQDATGKRALHEAAASGALNVARLLVERGAEIDPRESAYGGTPMGWASHGDQTAVLDYLSRYSRNIWTLCFCGYVDRVREILSEEPERARAIGAEGETPLWWLPDDDAKAAAIVDLLLAAGANPAATSQSGKTAADWARRRGMTAIAQRLENQVRQVR
jgi:ankyrin repeat protein